MDKWLDRLRSLVPSWVSSLFFNAQAKALDALEKNLEEHISQTFVDTARGEFLDLIGNGRGRPRQEGEPDSRYRARIKVLTNSSSCPALKALIDPILPTGEAFVGRLERPFFNGDFFLNGGTVLRDEIEEKNTFAVIVPNQDLPARSFFNGDFFLNGGSFFGSLRPSGQLFDSIVQIVENEKAFGTMFIFLERIK